jgi:RHS repeat-associated protein
MPLVPPQYAYTSVGKIRSYIRTIDGSNYSQFFTYDRGGRITQLTYPDSSYADYAYTDAGNLATVSLNGTVYASWSDYNASGLPKKVAYANQVATAYGYDSVSRLQTLVTSGPGATLQNLAFAFGPDGMDVAQITDHRASTLVNGADTSETQSFSYDALRRLTGASGVWGTKSYAYTATGNPIAFGGLIQRDLTFDGQQVTSGTGLSGVTYDAAGNMTHKVLDGVTWDYAWTAENRLATASKNGVMTARMTYDAKGNRVKRISNSKNGTVTTTYVGDMYEKRVFADGTQRQTIYLYANDQLIASWTRSGDVAAALGPLPQHLQQYALASMYDAGSALGASLKIYHLAGALAMNPRLPLVLYAIFVGALGAAFAWSLLRKKKRFNGGVHAPERAPWVRVAALGTVLVFVGSACSRGSGGSLDLGYASHELLAGDTLSGPALGTYFYHRNHVNSSSVITDAQGSEVTRVVYLPFGEVSQANSSGNDAVTKKFTGQENDEDTGLHYYKARYYDPAIGRFLSPDTIVPSVWDAQALNRYSYVRNNPVNLIDPTGHSWLAGVLVVVFGPHNPIVAAVVAVAAVGILIYAGLVAFGVVPNPFQKPNSTGGSSPSPPSSTPSPNNSGSGSTGTGGRAQSGGSGGDTGVPSSGADNASAIHGQAAGSASAPGGRLEIDAIDPSSTAGWLAAATRVGEVYMHDTKSMVDAVLARAAGDRISRLNIIDHVDVQSEGFEIGDDFVYGRNLGRYSPELERLRGHFSSDGFVHLQGCNMGRFPELLESLSASFGVPVYAGTGYHNPVLRFNTGDYVRCDVYSCSPSERP